LTQATLFDGRQYEKEGATLEAWTDTTSTVGVNHDTDFFYCERVEFNFRTPDGKDNGNTIVYRQLLLSAFIRFEWSNGILEHYAGSMRITSPCADDHTCWAYNGQVECVADDDLTDSNGIPVLPRKDYFASVMNVTLEVANNVQLV
jgi:hypothetical protein